MYLRLRINGQLRYPLCKKRDVSWASPLAKIFAASSRSARCIDFQTPVSFRRMHGNRCKCRKTARIYEARVPLVNFLAWLSHCISQLPMALTFDIGNRRAFLVFFEESHNTRQASSSHTCSVVLISAREKKCTELGWFTFLWPI